MVIAMVIAMVIYKGDNHRVMNALTSKIIKNTRLWYPFLSKSWQQHVPSWRLDVLRILVYGTIILWTINYQFQDYHKISNVFYKPTGFFSLFPALHLNPSLTNWITDNRLIILLLGLIGVGGRSIHLINLFISYCLLGINQNFYKVGHDGVLLIFSLIIFVFANPNFNFSIDRFFKKKLSKSTNFWPIHLIQLTMICCYFIAACQKIRFLTPAFEKNIEYVHYFFNTLHGPWSDFISSSPYLHWPLVVSLIFLQFISPLALAKTRIRPYIVSSLFLFHALSYLLASDLFLPWMVMYYCWLPIENLPSKKNPVHLPLRTPIGLATIIVLGHVWCAITVKDFWPWGPYTMYAKARIYLSYSSIISYPLAWRSPNGQIKPFKETDYPLPKSRVRKAIRYFVKRKETAKLNQALKSIIDYNNDRKDHPDRELLLLKKTHNLKTNLVDKKIIWQKNLTK